MRAWVRESYGGPGVLRLAERPDPVPGPGELLVRVHATTVNRTDLAYLTGSPRINRAFVGWPRPRPWARVLGSEYAGLVEAVGPGVTSYAVGDRVCGFVDGRPGSHAERVVVAADSLVAAIPDGWSYADAAPATEGAHYALACPRVAGTKPGDRVLVIGATGAIVRRVPRAAHPARQLRLLRPRPRRTEPAGGRGLPARAHPGPEGLPVGRR